MQHHTWEQSWITASVLPTPAMCAQEGDRQTVSQTQGLCLLLVFPSVPRTFLAEVGSAGQ